MRKKKEVESNRNRKNIMEREKKGENGLFMNLIGAMKGARLDYLLVT